MPVFYLSANIVNLEHTCICILHIQLHFFYINIIIITIHVHWSSWYRHRNIYICICTHWKALVTSCSIPNTKYIIQDGVPGSVGLMKWCRRIGLSDARIRWVPRSDQVIALIAPSVRLIGLRGWEQGARIALDGLRRGILDGWLHLECAVRAGDTHGDFWYIYYIGIVS